MAVQQGNAIEAAKELENNFDDLVEFLMTEISKINVDKLRYRISKYFEKEEGMVNDEIEKHLTKIEDYDRHSAILNYFRRHRFIGYFNYSLIKVFQEIAKSRLLDKRIEEYEKDYQCFLELSLSHIHDAFQQCPDLRPDYPAGIPKFTIHLTSEWEGKSMLNLKEFLKQCFNDSDCVDQLMIAKISRNCIIITFAVLPHIARKVLGYLTNDDVITSMKKEGISVDISQQLMEYNEELETTDSIASMLNDKDGRILQLSTELSEKQKQIQDSHVRCQSLESELKEKDGRIQQLSTENQKLIQDSHVRCQLLESEIEALKKAKEQSFIDKMIGIQPYNTLERKIHGSTHTLKRTLV